MLLINAPDNAPESVLIRPEVSLPPICTSVPRDWLMLTLEKWMLPEGSRCFSNVLELVDPLIFIYTLKVRQDVDQGFA